jgi:hypothetical protein
MCESETQFPDHFRRKKKIQKSYSTNSNKLAVPTLLKATKKNPKYAVSDGQNWFENWFESSQAHELENECGKLEKNWKKSVNAISTMPTNSHDSPINNIQLGKLELRATKGRVIW